MSKTKRLPRRDYRDKNGEKLPGVTTVIGDGLGWSKNGLIGWAYRLGREGRSLAERDQAADKGTATHVLAWRALGYDDGTPVSEEQEREHGPNAARVVDLIRSHPWEIVACEEPIVADFGGGLGVGGTLDLIVRHATRGFGIVDLKTGKGVYDEVAIQLGAYTRMVEHTSPNRIEWCSVIHAHPGEPLALVDVPMPSVNAGARVFAHLLAIYHERKHVKVPR